MNKFRSTLAVAQEHVKTLEYKIELLNRKLPVALLADSECWKHKCRRMMDPSYCPVNSNENSSQNSVKVVAIPKKRSCMTMKCTPSTQDSANWYLPLC
jgi:hypothetical protein